LNKSLGTLVPVTVELLIDRLRDRGWRLTSQRRVVAEVLSGPNLHMTADEILDQAQERLPEISRATVYNTLTELVAMGEVAEVNTDGRARRYDPNPDHTHQHLVCDVCGRILDVSLGNEAVPTLPARERHGFVVRGAEVTYRGVCPDCASRQQPRQ
jgi:Fur family ferric uptake transcriptional regulator